MVVVTITYLFFLKKYKEYHKEENKHRIKLDKIWLDLRKKHGVMESKYYHRLSAKDYPPEFHKEAGDMVARWRLSSRERSNQATRMFLGLFSKAKKRV